MSEIHTTYSFSNKKRKFEKTCRTCACIFSDESNLISIFTYLKISDSEKKTTILSILDEILKIQIEEDDGLPQKICNRCFNQLCSIEKFRELCFKSQDKLQNYLINYSTKEIKLENEDVQSDTETEPINIDDIKEEIDFIDVENVRYFQSIRKENENYLKNDDSFTIDGAMEYNKNISDDDDDNDYEYECWFCEKSYKNWQRLKEHEETAHSKLFIVNECKHCQRPFKSFEKFEAHIRKHNICKICGTHFNRKLLLAKHLHTHKPIDPRLQCEYCGQIFSQESRLTFHLKLVHMTKEDRKLQKSKSTPEYQSNYKCPYPKCSQSFIIPTGLERHMKLHDKNRKYQCTECDLRYVRSEHLQRHLNTAHFKTKSYQCPICHKSFFDIEVRNKHVKYHDEREYKCDKCGKVYASLNYYKIHQRLHSGEKPAVCSICGKTFPCNNYLKSHQKKHTAEEHEKLQKEILAKKSDELLSTNRDLSIN